jgi:hypothetical protein
VSAGDAAARVACTLALPLALTAGLGLGCGPSVEPFGDAGTSTDAGFTAPARPELDAVPARIPYPLATLRGRSRGRRVLVEGAGNPVATQVLPDGTFCADVPLRQPGSFMLEVFAQSEQGVLSSDGAAATVEFDPSAPPIAGASTCAGADPAGCAGTAEICDNVRDDDCDGLADQRDPDCAPCRDDLLEPNDGPSAPLVSLGRTEDLVSCPGNEDHYGVFLRAGEALRARIFFRHADGNLDLTIYEGAPSRTLARSTSLDDDEAATVSSTAARTLVVRVYGVGAARTGYVLDLAAE